MWRSKKFIVVALLAAVVLAGSIGGVALARTGSGNPAGVLLAQNVSENVSQRDVLFTRVAEILVGKGIDITSEQLEDAFAQAQSEMRDEALDSYLQNLVDEGKITQEEADQYKAWWQSRPDMEPFRQQLEAWQQARPDTPLPGPFGGFGGRGFGGGMKWGGGRCFGGR